MSKETEKTKEVNSRTGQNPPPLPFAVNSHDDYMALRQALAALPQIPTVVNIADAQIEKRPGREYRWLVTSEQSGGTIALHHMILEPGFDAGRHHHPMEEEFFYILQGQLEMTIGTKSGVFGPGTLAYAPPHATHAFRTFGGKPCHLLHWNSPGGHERMGHAQEKAAKEQRLNPELRKKIMEDHDFIFHD